jgi:ABC-type uncharacterized transport system permease subunit
VAAGAAAAMAGAIFGGNINAICTALMMVAMLVFAVAWEAFTGYLDRRVRLPCSCVCA